MGQEGRWKFVFGASFAGAALLAACTVSTGVDTTNTPGGTGGAGGSDATGGSAGVSGLGGAAGITGTGGSAGITGTGGSAGITGAGGTVGAGGTSGVGASIRFAIVAPDVGAVDLCFRQQNSPDWTSTNATGPYFSKAGHAGKFYYPGVSVYIPIDAGDWEFRLVDAAATDCSTPYDAHFADQPGTLNGGTTYTLAIEGEQAQALRFAVFPDAANPTNGKVGYQVINALTGTGPVDFGLLDPSNNFTTVAAGVVALGADAQGSSDPNTTSKPTFLASGSTTAVYTGPVYNFGPNEQYTVFAIGTKAGDATPGKLPSLIVCGYDPSNTLGESELIAKACVYGMGQ